LVDEPWVKAPAPRPLIAARYALLALVCSAALIYFTWRGGAVNPAHPVFGWCVYAAELVGFARTLLFLLSAVRLSHRAAPEPAAGLHVDVFITTLDEPDAIVRRTLAAAHAMRYPHETWLLDDGNRPAMRALAEQIGCRYLARAKTTGAKTGNLNRALAAARGDFVAVFDADHVAAPAFLERTLGYFSDARVAFVQTPHEFRNGDSFDHLAPARTISHGQAAFHHVVQHSRDGANATVFPGSAAVFRRTALDAIGGFATGTVTEDVHTSLRLHAAGWHSVFHPEVVATGLAALDSAGYYAQRLRWAHGAVQLMVRENLTGRSGLTARQRQSYIFHVVSNLEGWRYLFVYVLPLAILITGVLPLRTAAAAFGLAFAPYCIASFLATTEFARGHGRVFESTVYNLTRIPTSIRATFGGGRTDRVFAVTPKTRGAQRGTHEDAFPWIVATAGIVAIAYGTGAALMGRTSLSGAALAAVVLWAGYNTAVAVRLIALTRRCAHAATASQQHPLEAFARTDRGDCGGYLSALFPALVRSVDADVPYGVEVALRESAEGDHRFGAHDAAARRNLLRHEFAELIVLADAGDRH
jgi:cellulose synthase (UDP-forming)